MKKIQSVKKILTFTIIVGLGLGCGAYTGYATRDIDFYGLFKKAVSFGDQNDKDPVSYYTTHPSWKGYLMLLPENRVHLDATNDSATVIEHKDGLLTVKWDKWGTESFECNEKKRTCTLKKN